MILAAACAAPPGGMLRANLATGDTAAVRQIAAAFEASNPGHELRWRPGLRTIEADSRGRVLLVQEGETRVEASKADGSVVASDLTVGDVILIGPGESAQFGSAIDVLEFTLPDAPAAVVPRVIRPDWDPRITDTPGGCATDPGAYRRVLLTWLGKNGPYTFHGLNVHRVRIDDSFTHYHPLVGGFDEFYLVQAVRPGARILTSERTADIVKPETVRREDVGELLRSTELAVSDLVYLPRGTAHRGVGGVVTQVITVPGFVPGAEIGLDHHLRAINERLGLTGDAALPLHLAGAERPIVR